MRRGALAAIGSAALLAAGCDAGEDERVDRAVEPPPGWQALASRSGRFTFAAPRSWSVRREGREITILSPTRTTAVTLRADRSPEGQRISAADYAFRTLRTLPRFAGRVVPGPARVSGTPYRNARVWALGRLRGAPGRKRVSAVALQVPDQVTYAVSVFGGGDAGTVDQVIRTLRSGLG